MKVYVSCSVRQRSEDEWMLDPVIIADTYGASEGREVHFILALNKLFFCNSLFYMIWLLSLEFDVALNNKSRIYILFYKEENMGM